MKKNQNTQNNIRFVLFTILALILLKPFSSSAQSSPDDLLSSNPQKLARGIGHFERARSLLLAAIREYDSGLKYVKTDQVLDSDAWRNSIIARASELETVLSPKPREIKVGSRYEADTRLLGAKVKPEANLKANSVVKPEIKTIPEAKVEKQPIPSKEGLESSLNGS